MPEFAAAVRGAATPTVQEIELPVSFAALAVERAGGPIRSEQRTITSVKEDEVLVRVSYASINRMDPFLALRNLFGLPEPYVLGFDFSGEVVRLGEESKKGLQVGDQVFGSAITGGCYAEYLVAKLGDIALRGPVPAKEASTYGIAYLTAYESLIVTADIQQHAGKWIYIAGAGGGLGHFAVQLAKLSGLKVIGSAGKAASLDLLRQLSVDHVIDYSRQDVVEEIMRVTGGKGADLVYDSTYTQASYDVSTAVVARDGEYIRLGTEVQVQRSGARDMRAVVESRGAKWTIGDLGRYGTDPDYKPQVSKVKQGLKQAVTWYEQGKLKPFISSTVSFDPAALQAAFDDFLKGLNNVGKVVVQCNPDLASA